LIGSHQARFAAALRRACNDSSSRNPGLPHQQRLDLARLDPQRHVIIGLEIAEIFVDADRFQEIVAFGR